MRTPEGAAMFALLMSLLAGIVVAACAGNEAGAGSGSVRADGATVSPTISLREATRAPRRPGNLPASIDASGKLDASEGLQRAIDEAPDGATLVFKPGGRYRLDQALRIHGRRDLTLDGNGARLDLPRQDQSFDSIGIHVRDGSVGTTIRDFVIVGNNTRAGTSEACCERENNHAIAVLSARDTLIEGVEIRRTWGDCLYISLSSTGGPSEGVTFRDSTCRLSGRHGIGLIAGNDVRILDNVFDDIGFDVVDIEPNRKDQGARGVLIEGNDVGAYALDADYAGWLLAACGPDDLGAVVEDVTVKGNTVEGNVGGWNGVAKGLSFKVCGERGPRRNFVVTDNVARSSVAGPAMTFTEVQGVTVRGNTQPLTRGELATFPGSTGVSYDG